MRYRNLVRGQAMVEAALILPLLFFAMWGYLYFLTQCRKALQTQNEAATSARAEALDEKSRVRNAERILPWRPFRGFGVVRREGYLISAESHATFMPRRFMQWHLPAVSLVYSARFPKEPPMPEES